MSDVPPEHQDEGQRQTEQTKEDLDELREREQDAGQDDAERKRQRELAKQKPAARS